MELVVVLLLPRWLPASSAPLALCNNKKLCRRYPYRQRHPTENYSKTPLVVCDSTGETEKEEEEKRHERLKKRPRYDAAHRNKIIPCAKRARRKKGHPKAPFDGSWLELFQGTVNGWPVDRGVVGWRLVRFKWEYVGGFLRSILKCMVNKI